MTDTPALIRKIVNGLRGATLTEAEAAEIISMVKSRTRKEYPEPYLLNVAQDLMPESAYIEWARAHLAKLDVRDA